MIKSRLEEISDADDMDYDQLVDANNWLIKRVRELEAQLQIAKEVLEKISDPRKRDHREPDKYTEVGCMIHMAEVALAQFTEAQAEEKNKS